MNDFDDEYEQAMQGRISVGAEHHDPINPASPKAALGPAPTSPAEFRKHVQVKEFPAADTIVPIEQARAMAQSVLPSRPERSEVPAVELTRVNVALEDAKRQQKAARTKDAHDEAGLRIAELTARVQELSAQPIEPIQRSPSSPFAQINEKMQKELESAPVAPEGVEDGVVLSSEVPKAAAAAPTDSFGDWYSPAVDETQTSTPGVYAHYEHTVNGDRVEIRVPSTFTEQGEPVVVQSERTFEQELPTMQADTVLKPEPEAPQAVEYGSPTMFVEEPEVPKVAAHVEQGDSATPSLTALFNNDGGDAPRVIPRLPVAPSVNTNAAQQINQMVRGAVPMTLPSRQASYGKMNISITRLNVASVRDIIRASATQSIRLLVSTLGSTIHGFDIMSMSEVDFHYTMYWHRMNSYKKLPFVVPWTCTDKEHVARITQNLAPAKSLKNSTMVNASTLEIRELDDMAYQNMSAAFLQEYGLKVGLPTVRDMVTVVEQEAEAFDVYKAKLASMGVFEHKRDKQGQIPDEALDAFLESDEMDDEVLVLPNYRDVVKAKAKVLGEMTARNYANHYSSLLDNNYGDLNARWKLISTLPPDALMQLDELAKLADSYGVNESWKVTCAECGASKRVVYRLDALTFLPAV